MKCCPTCGARMLHHCHHFGEDVRSIEMSPELAAALLKRHIENIREELADIREELADFEEQLADAERIGFALSMPYAGYG